MIQKHQPRVVRFGPFELDLRTCELRKNDRRIRLQDQPAKLLALLATHPGELVTREDIEKALWQDRVVEFEHAINDAVKKIRRALSDDPEKPKYVETLHRRGYRFIAKVEEVYAADPPNATEAELVTVPSAPAVTSNDGPQERERSAVDLTQKEEPPREFVLPLSIRVSRALFLIIQVGYLAIYGAVLHYVDALEWGLVTFRLITVQVKLSPVIILTMCSSAVRIYLLSAVGWAHPEAGEKFKRLFPILLVLDAVWAASPLLAAGRIDSAVVFLGVAGLAYLPFAQRTLIWSIYRSTPDRK